MVKMFFVGVCALALAGCTGSAFEAGTTVRDDAREAGAEVVEFGEAGGDADGGWACTSFSNGTCECFRGLDARGDEHFAPSCAGPTVCCATFGTDICSCTTSDAGCEGVAARGGSVVAACPN